MPVLKDMTNLFVGATPVEKVYAGTNLVWQRDRDFEVEQYIDKRSASDAWCMSWSYYCDPFTCEEAGNLFSIRWEVFPLGTGNWTPWFRFDEKAFAYNQTWLYKEDDRFIWCDIGSPLSNGVGGKWQVRLVQDGETITKEIVKTNISGVGPNAPNEWFETQCV
ncbi:MAG: hypothetical protein ACR2NI_10605 [Pirellulales bacterium]